MFNINDVVVYGAQGVCEIVGIVNQKVGKDTKEYFVLKPKDNSSSTFYVPTGNEKAWSKMRMILQKEDIDALIDSMAHQTHSWIKNENERKEAYKHILTEGNHSAIIAMLQAIWIHKKELAAEGKRLHMVDEYFMKDAERLLYNEWQYVLNMDRDGLMEYIMHRIEKE